MKELSELPVPCYVPVCKIQGVAVFLFTVHCCVGSVFSLEIKRLRPSRHFFSSPVAITCFHSLTVLSVYVLKHVLGAALCILKKVWLSNDMSNNNVNGSKLKGKCLNPYVSHFLCCSMQFKNDELEVSKLFKETLKKEYSLMYYTSITNILELTFSLYHHHFMFWVEMKRIGPPTMFTALYEHGMGSPPPCP